MDKILNGYFSVIQGYGISAEEHFKDADKHKFELPKDLLKSAENSVCNAMSQLDSPELKNALEKIQKTKQLLDK